MDAYQRKGTFALFAQAKYGEGLTRQIAQDLYKQIQEQREIQRMSPSGINPIGKGIDEFGNPVSLVNPPKQSQAPRLPSLNGKPMSINPNASVEKLRAEGLSDSQIGQLKQQSIVPKAPSFLEQVKQGRERAGIFGAAYEVVKKGTSYIPPDAPIRRGITFVKETRQDIRDTLTGVGVKIYTKEQKASFERRLKFQQPTYDESGNLISGVQFEALPQDLKDYLLWKQANVISEIGVMGGGVTPQAVIGVTTKVIKNPLKTSGTLKTEPLVPSQAISGEAVYTIGAPLERFSFTDQLTGKLVVQEKYDVLGVNKRIVSEGRKTILQPDKTLYPRINPPPTYAGIPSDVKGYQEALRYLKKVGKYTDKEAREVLRLRRPQVVEEYFRGQGILTMAEDGKTTFNLLGRERVLSSKGETGGVRWLQKEPEVRFLKSAGEESGKFFQVVSEQERAFLRSGKYPYTKLRQQGKLKDNFEGLVGSKFIKEYPTGELYRGLEVSRTTIPRQRIPSASTAKVFVRTGAEPFWSITDESIVGARGFLGGSKKSSSQFLQNMYKTNELTTSTVLGLEKVKPIKPTRVIDEIKAPEMLNMNLPKSEFAVTLPREETKTIQKETSELSQVWSSGGRVSSGFTPLLDKAIGIARERVQAELKLTPINILKSFETQKPIELFREGQKPSQTIIQRQNQGQNLRQLYNFLSTQTKQPRSPRPRLSRLKLPSSDFLSLPKTKRAEVLFEVFGRRKGKDTVIARKGTLGEAQLELKKFLTGTLGASGLIRRRGKPVKVNLGFQFRQAKRESTRVVQRSKFRLGTLSEVSEIQRARRIKLLK